MWTVIGLVGCYFGISNLRFSRRDIVALHETNGRTLAQFRIMSVLAYGHFRNDLLRFSAQLTITIVGVIAMIIPRGEASSHITPTGILITAGFFFIALEIVIASILDRNQRDAMEVLIKDDR